MHCLFLCVLGKVQGVFAFSPCNFPSLRNNNLPLEEDESFSFPFFPSPLPHRKVQGVVYFDLKSHLMVNESTVIAIASVVAGMLLVVLLYFCCRQESAVTSDERSTAQSVGETTTLVAETVSTVTSVLDIVKN